ncbi:MAG TPA: DUF58 domain-containing protein [Longimicrobiales bacterium]|nr:DUF58 domain-containing protein [Longimicrobiales bacterium]
MRGSRLLAVRGLGLGRRVWSRIGEMRRQLRAWRRISFTAGGALFTAGAFAVGFAAMNTGNNLLFLLLGAMLGIITVSGWLSEQAIRAVRVERLLPRAVTAGQELRIAYEVANHKRRLPSMAVEILDGELPGRAFLPYVAAGSTTRTRSVNTLERRGVYPLLTVTLSTSFPFGMFRKERDLDVPGEIVVWPRTDRPVPVTSQGGGRVPRSGAGAQGPHGHRGEYRSLRAYRAGDDPRDIHWRSSARLRDPVLREYERDGAETRWICLDLASAPGDPAEVAVEAAASLAAQAMAEGRSFALVAGPTVVDPGEGAGQLERVLDVLARVSFSPGAPLPDPPVDPGSCILVSVDGAPGFGDAVVVGRHA